MQRFVWDLHYPPPIVDRYEYSISEIDGDTPRNRVGPFVGPGQYTAKRTVNGKSYTQPLRVVMDPRVKTPPDGLAQQLTASMQAYDGLRQAREAQAQVKNLREQPKGLSERAGQGPLADAIRSLDQKAAAIEGGGEGGPRGGGAAGRAGDASFTSLNAAMLALLEVLQGSDTTPTTQAVAASEEMQKTLAALLARWNEIRD